MNPNTTHLKFSNVTESNMGIIFRCFVKTSTVLKKCHELDVGRLIIKNDLEIKEFMNNVVPNLKTILSSRYWVLKWLIGHDKFSKVSSSIFLFLQQKDQQYDTRLREKLRIMYSPYITVKLGSNQYNCTIYNSNRKLIKSIEVKEK